MGNYRNECFFFIPLFTVLLNKSIEWPASTQDGEKDDFAKNVA